MVQNKKLNLFFLVLWIFLSLVGLSFITTTFDNGDSISHYLHARYSWHHPDLLLNHWAKPFFTLITSPFAQFGIVGMKVFNIFCIALSGFITAELLRISNIKYYWLVFPMLFFANDYFLIQYSGLTEPLFALVLMSGFYLIAKNKWKYASIVFSILPFVRTEGFLVLPIIGIYFLNFNKTKSLIWLSFGFIAYAILGKIYLGDFLWYFNENPYDSKAFQYGHGTWTYFLEQFPYVTGVPFASICLLAFIWSVFNFKSLTPIMRLFMGIFFLYFTFHSYAWAMGKFNSFGMTRVLIGIMPIAAFFNIWLINKLAFKFHLNQQWVSIIVVILCTGFAFAQNPVSLSISDLKLSPTQQLMVQVALKFKTKIQKSPVIYCGDQYLLMKTGIDPWSGYAKKMHGLKTDSVQKGALVFWDSYYSPRDYGIEKTYLSSNSNYSALDSFYYKDFSLFVYYKKTK